MRVCGIICEYNPFHNGHAYHLARAKVLSRADYTVCVMSGSYTQRGEPALADKWSRARMALLSGADLVVELPALFAVRPAEDFALGGVAMLNALGVSALAFGSECGDLSALENTAARLEEETPSFLAGLRAELALGASLARARARALEDALPPAALDALAQPNSALAICYLRAMRASGSPMEPILIPRTGGAHHDDAPGPLASASAVRAAVETVRWEDVRAAVPESVYALLRDANEQGRLHLPGALDTALLAALRTKPVGEIAVLCDVNEGLEYRIQRSAWAAGDREQLLAAVKCKRYTRTRLSRILCAAQLGMTRELADRFPAPTYARVLGFRAGARPLLSRLKRIANLPLVTKTASAGLRDDGCFALDLRATDLWVLGCASPSARAARRDLLTPPVIV